MRNLLAALAATAVLTAGAIPAVAQNPNREYRRDVREAQKDYRRDVREARKERREAIRDWREYRNLDYNRPDPYYGRYYAERYYRDGRYYRPYTLSRRDRIYRGSNGNYYCRRSDGTTGLIIGAAVGGLLGNSVTRGDSRVLGTIIGGGAGALLGREIDRGGVRCR
jgi:Glycine zipper 2TM domain